VTAGSARVFLVDDDPFQLVFLTGILSTAGHQVEAFARPEALFALLSASDRGCVVLDLRMPVLSGLELQAGLLARGVLLPLIFVSGSADVPAVVSAMKHGALDFLAKPVVPAELRAVVAGALRRDEETARERAVCARARDLWAALSERERHVCRLFARGLLNKQIAAEMGSNMSTVQAQRMRALQKLRVSAPADLARLMTQAGDPGEG
jgi:FixJ family two-component response regulator